MSRIILKVMLKIICGPIAPLCGSSHEPLKIDHSIQQDSVLPVLVNLNNWLTTYNLGCYFLFIYSYCIDAVDNCHRYLQPEINLVERSERR